MAATPDIVSSADTVNVTGWDHTTPLWRQSAVVAGPVRSILTVAVLETVRPAPESARPYRVVVPSWVTATTVAVAGTAEPLLVV